MTSEPSAARLLELAEGQMGVCAVEALKHNPGQARAINRKAAAEWATIALALRARASSPPASDKETK